MSNKYCIIAWHIKRLLIAHKSYFYTNIKFYAQRLAGAEHSASYRCELGTDGAGVGPHPTPSPIHFRTFGTDGAGFLASGAA